MTTPLSTTIHTPDSEPITPPRAETALSRRRAWTEPGVRFWWISSLIFVATAVYFAISQYQLLASEARLLQEGVVVNAIVRTADAEPVSGKNKPSGSICELRYEYKGVVHDVTG